MGKELEFRQSLSVSDRHLCDTRCSEEYPQFDLGTDGTGVVKPPACVGNIIVANALATLGSSEAVLSSKTDLHCMPPFATGLSFLSGASHNENPLSEISGMEKISADVYGKLQFPIIPSGVTAKQFLVFDQTGGKTTLIYCSGIDFSVRCPASSILKPTNCFDLNVNDAEITGDPHQISDPILTTVDSRCSDSCGMNENTDEIDALLSSEAEDGYSDNDEETSTGHSPSTLTGYNKEESLEEGMEEVASYPLPSKRVKVSPASYAIPPSSYYAAPTNPSKSSDYEDDAASSNAGGVATKYADTTCSSGKKRERICETVKILRSIIPGGRGSNPVMVLDEAIHYLKSLKLEARSLGLLNL